ncbi:hypothetical protein WA538_004958 [Blastocystis sp. DL]
MKGVYSLPFVCLLLLGMAVGENMEKCSSGCLNGGHCSPDTNACICPSNCEGVHCEVCHHSFPFSLILGVLCSLGVLVYLVILVVDYVKRKCRFYSPVAVEDPFVQNMKSIGQLAGERDLRKGQLYSSAAFELRSKRRWFRVRK